MSETRWVLVWLLCGASGAAASSATPAPVRFTPDIQRLLTRNCAACHNAQDPQGGLDLQPDHAYANLVGKRATQVDLPLVDPGRPERSYLYRKLVGTQLEVGGQGDAMPVGGRRLTEKDLDAVRRWIEAGAQ